MTIDDDESADGVRTCLVHGAGIDLAADVRGRDDGRAAVLLHGGGQTRHAWGTAADTLARDGWFVVSVDQRGHGDSQWAPDGDYRIDTFAADVVAVASRFERPPVLVGASLGGVASLVAIGESDREVATALVLVDVTPTIDQEGADRIRRFMLEGMRGFDRLEDAADFIAEFLPARPRPKDLSGLRKNLRLRDDGRWYWHWDLRFVEPPEGVDGQRGRIDHDRLVRAARRVRVPTLLVRGQMSDIVSEDAVRELQELIPHAEVANVADAGHMVAGDRNDAFNRAVIDFVTRSGPR